MTQTLTWTEIEARLADVDLIGAMRKAFAAYSRGEAVIPPVGELVFDDPPGDVHIKYGYQKGGSHYVVKIASGFYNNPELGLSSCQGLMLLFDQRTGVPHTVLLDEGRLTDARTGAAGALAAQLLMPESVESIGIMGSGIQARVQVSYLAKVTECRKLKLWGRNPQRARACAEDIEAMGFEVELTNVAQTLVRHSQLVITTTPATEPIVRSDWVQPGTHIVALGSDTPTKQELDPQLLDRADQIVVDSASQSQSRGETFRAREAGVDLDAKTTELGKLCVSMKPAERSLDGITIADLTGVAIQDLHAALAAAGL